LFFADTTDACNRSTLSIHFKVTAKISFLFSLRPNPSVPSAVIRRGFGRQRE
jgi:hypothetical protein